MAAWPELDELKQVLDVTSSEWDGDYDSPDLTRLARLLAAAIAHTKGDIGNWDEYTDEPTDAQAQAALRMAELMALRPEVAPAALADPTYWRLLKGSRRAFGIA